MTDYGMFTVPFDVPCSVCSQKRTLIAAVGMSALAPSAKLEPGQRTDKFRLGGDQLLIDANGESKISVQDYAAAMIDELERPAHVRRRFTVGY